MNLQVARDLRQRIPLTKRGHNGRVPGDAGNRAVEDGIQRASALATRYFSAGWRTVGLEPGDECIVAENRRPGELQRVGIHLEDRPSELVPALRRIIGGHYLRVAGCSPGKADGWPGQPSRDSCSRATAPASGPSQHAPD